MPMTIVTPLFAIITHAIMPYYAITPALVIHSCRHYYTIITPLRHYCPPARRHAVIKHAAIIIVAITLLPLSHHYYYYYY